MSLYSRVAERTGYPRDFCKETIFAILYLKRPKEDYPFLWTEYNAALREIQGDPE